MADQTLSSEPSELTQFWYRGLRILTSVVYPSDWDDCQQCGYPVFTWDTAWFIDEAEGSLYGPFCSRSCAKRKVDRWLEA